ncbi:MAG: agmatine deiminase family protein [Wenzhouxiangella sp.]
MHPESARLPAEWARQTATLLAFPPADGDWGGRLEAIRQEYRQLIDGIRRFQTVIVLVPPEEPDLTQALGGLGNVVCVPISVNDTWCRDYGPICLQVGPDTLALDFHFNGWGGKYDARLDNQVNQTLASHPLFARFCFQSLPFELEGGAIESDGCGSLLINWHCLQTRHPGLNREQISQELRRSLAVERVIGIDVPPTEGDDTDGHIDTLARFVDEQTIAWQRQADPQRSRLIEAQLQSLRRANGEPYRLIPLPQPTGFDPELPANYANFLFVNGACLVPAYGVAADSDARALLARALPGHDVISLPSAQLISQFGSIHCATMHIPEPQS